jgi:hypothetical protein
VNRRLPWFQDLFASLIFDLVADVVLQGTTPAKEPESEEERVNRIAAELLADVDLSFA